MEFGQQFRSFGRELGSFTCPKAGTWDTLFYFPSEGRRAVNFSNRRLRSGANPRSWVPEASMLTTRPPKPLCNHIKRTTLLSSSGHFRKQTREAIPLGSYGLRPTSCGPNSKWAFFELWHFSYRGVWYNVSLKCKYGYVFVYIMCFAPINQSILILLLLILWSTYRILGQAAGAAVGWGTVLLAVRWFRFPMVSLEFFIDIMFPAALWPWGWLSL
jgi:hypothetical protein